MCSSFETCTSCKSDAQSCQLPLPCIMNSRYNTPEHLQGLMRALNYTQIKTRWKTNGKMAYWLYQKTQPSEIQVKNDITTYQKKTTLRQGNRNNFSILL